jgi:DNA-binding transcriptional ArsR family regulator
VKSTKCAYIPHVARFTHPRLEDVPLDLALHALADPNRLGMVARLAVTDALSCTGAAPCESLPKSTLSNHLKLLRAAGLIQTTQSGREMINTLRRGDFDRRFPGLLDAVLANAVAPTGSDKPLGASTPD